MGLLKRNNVWWMSFMYKRRQILRTTGTTDKRLAEEILAKITYEIAEGRYFESRCRV